MPIGGGRSHLARSPSGQFSPCLPEQAQPVTFQNTCDKTHVSSET